MTTEAFKIARCVTPAGRHHFYGFHDVSPWGCGDTRMLALAVSSIDHPPAESSQAHVGISDPGTGDFFVRDSTTGWNFPQGARQLWLPGRKRYAYNCPDRAEPRTRIRDDGGTLLGEYPWGIAAISPVEEVFYSIDFGGVHRSGGYGHTGVRCWDAGEQIEREGGLVMVNIASGAASTVVSLNAIRDAAGRSQAASADDRLDYITHVVPSPSGTRLCFLYRSWLADGGIDTVLMVVDSDGRALRKLIRGNLSHFDWRDENSIVIWGPRRQLVAALRGQGGKRRGAGSSVLKAIKEMIRPLVRRSGMLAAAYLDVRLDGSPVTPYFPKILARDGHPSFCPEKRHWMLADTYPDAEGDRELFLVDTRVGQKHLLGTYREPRMTPDMEASAGAMTRIDPTVLKVIGERQYAFTRSGLHCDLHPRWRNDGLQVSFDSLHEGPRLVYVVDTAALVGHDT